MLVVQMRATRLLVRSFMRAHGKLRRRARCLCHTIYACVTQSASNIIIPMCANHMLCLVRMRVCSYDVYGEDNDLVHVQVDSKCMCICYTKCKRARPFVCATQSELTCKRRHLHSASRIDRVDETHCLRAHRLECAVQERRGCCHAHIGVGKPARRAVLRAASVTRSLPSSNLRRIYCCIQT